MRGDKQAARVSLGFSTDLGGSMQPEAVFQFMSVDLSSHLGRWYVISSHTSFFIYDMGDLTLAILRFSDIAMSSFDQRLLQ